jgi:TldD protein
MASDTTGQSIFEQGEIAPEQAQSIVEEALAGADDGELFLEIRRSEVLSFDDSRLRSASFDSHQGFGLRAIHGETTALAHSTEISESSLRRAA